MSKEVKRYDPFGYDGLSALMHEDVLGDWVRASDYEALLAERDAAQKDAERWLPVHGYEGIYEVSSVGRVRSVERVDTAGNRRQAKILLPTAIPKGYLKVSLWKANQRSERYVHRLVAGAFIGNPDGLLQVNHMDGDPANNAASNLEWVSNAGNQKHARRVLMKGVRAVFGISKTDGSRIEFPSLQHAVEAGFIRANIQKCLNGERKMHGGYKWYDAALQGEQP